MLRGNFKGEPKPAPITAASAQSKQPDNALHDAYKMRTRKGGLEEAWLADSSCGAVESL